MLVTEQLMSSALLIDFQTLCMGTAGCAPTNIYNTINLHQI